MQRVIKISINICWAICHRLLLWMLIAESGGEKWPLAGISLMLLTICRRSARCYAGIIFLFMITAVIQHRLWYKVARWSLSPVFIPQYLQLAVSPSCSPPSSSSFLLLLLYTHVMTPTMRQQGKLSACSTARGTSLFVHSFYFCVDYYLLSASQCRYVPSLGWKKTSKLNISCPKSTKATSKTQMIYRKYISNRRLFLFFSAALGS